MSEFVAIYKCRLCGEILEGAHADTFSTAVQATASAVYNEPRAVQAPRLIEFHICADGSVGITDFQGFRKR